MPNPALPVTLTNDVLVRKGLRFSQLRLIAALKETGQISAAAAHLAMTQPAASRLLSELEKTVGATLYERHARGISLTEAGKVLAGRAQSILRQLDESQKEIEDHTLGRRGLVKIGAVTGPALEIILPVIRDLRIAYPKIEVSVQVDTSDKLAESLLAHDLDFYIGRLPLPFEASAFAMRSIGPEPIGFIVRMEHPLTRRETQTLEDCLDYDWVMQPPGGLLRRTVETYLMENSYPLPKRVLGTSSLLLTLAIISTTNAVAPIARSVGDFHTAPGGLGSNIRLLETGHDIAVTTYSLVRRNEGKLSPSAELVLSLVERKIVMRP